MLDLGDGAGGGEEGGVRGGGWKQRHGWLWKDITRPGLRCAEDASFRFFVQYVSSGRVRAYRVPVATFDILVFGSR